MTYVFSGNGMSARVADWIGDIPGTEGYVFPVYGWRLPKKVRRDLASGCRNAGAAFTWAVFTCGDDAGYIDRDLEGVLGCRLDAAYTVVMPDTYLGLPGFRLDSAEESAAKLAAAEVRCRNIRERLLAHTVERDMKRGLGAWLKTYAIGRFFDRFLVSDRFWKLDHDRCLRCGMCAERCPCGTISLDSEGFPRWKHDGSCTGCFRCYHGCKGGAIEFSRFTRGKGRLEA